MSDVFFSIKKHLNTIIKSVHTYTCMMHPKYKHTPKYKELKKQRCIHSKGNPNSKCGHGNTYKIMCNISHGARHGKDQENNPKKYKEKKNGSTNNKKSL